VDSKKQVLKLEVAVLKKLQGCPFVCRFITCGRYNDYNYMVMELLGDNLSELRRNQPAGRFSISTTLKLGTHMIRAIEAVHEMGYIHRDIKPSNFVMGLGSKKRTGFLIDFGLARRYMLPDGRVRPARETTGFRGTARYASINSHQCKDLSRRDDLWSVLYILIEFARGQLPWRRLKDKDKIGEMKVKFNTPELVKDLPHEFLNFMDHLQSLEYADKPDYNFLASLLQDLYTKAGGTDDMPYDWETRPQVANNAAAIRNRPLVKPNSLVALGAATPNQPQRQTMIASGYRLVANKFPTTAQSPENILESRRMAFLKNGSGNNDVGEDSGQQIADTSDTPDAPVDSDDSIVDAHQKIIQSPPQNAESDITEGSDKEVINTPIKLSDVEPSSKESSSEPQHNKKNAGPSNITLTQQPVYSTDSAQKETSTPVAKENKIANNTTKAHNTSEAEQKKPLTSSLPSLSSHADKGPKKQCCIGCVIL